MSYIVLARKYRPQSFKEVYAQEHVTEILQSAIESARIAHAYLFTGPRGVGKTSLARIMAKSLNCQQGPTKDPCNKCSNCIEITSGTSTDVIEIDGASNTGVDDIRELQRELLYAPSASKYKIYIIDEVHMLSKSAFNALLKTLEEPPENVIFIFATTEPQKVLPTIISRCQRYDFKRIPIDSIVARLKEISNAEVIRIDSESMYLIARKADGGMRDALSLMDQAISYCMDDISIDKVRQIFGLIPNQLYYQFMIYIKQKDAPALIQELHRVFEQGTDLQEFIANMLEFIRILLLRKLKVEVKDINPEELPLFDELGDSYSQNTLMYIMSYLIASKADLKTSTNPYLILEALMIKLCKLDELDDIAAILNQVKSGNALISRQSATAELPRTNTAPPLIKQTYKPVETGIVQHEQEISKLEFNQENVDAAWQRVVARAKKFSSMAGIALEKVLSKDVKGSKLCLSLDTNANLTIIKNNVDAIQNILKDLFAQAILLDLNYIEKESPTKVYIHRRSLDEIKEQSPEIAKYIEATESVLV